MSVAIRVGEAASRVRYCAVGFIAFMAWVIHNAVARSLHLAEAVLTLAISEAGIPSLEVIIYVVRVSLNRHLRRLGREVSWVIESGVKVGSPVPLYTIPYLRPVRIPI